MENNKRLLWIDAARGLGILGVIVFHTGFLPYIRIVDPLLMSWMLPVFVFTGGWLLKNTPFTPQKFISTIRRLLIPFFIAGIVSFIGWMVLRNIYPEHILNQPVAGELAKWLTGRNAFFDSPLWFIPAYFFASSIMQSVGVTWLRLRITIRCLLSIFFITTGLLLSNSFRYPIFSYDLILLFIGMMMMGSIASTVRVPKTNFRTAFDVLILILFIIIALSNGYIDIFQRQFGNKIIFITSAALGTYVVTRLLAWGLRKQNNIALGLSYVGRHSMTLLAWHWPVMQWLTYGLFVTRALQLIATNYTKTAFTFTAEGYKLVILQIIFSCIYTVITIYSILAVKKLFTPIRTPSFTWKLRKGKPA